jgi:hypothetical protein
VVSEACVVTSNELQSIGPSISVAENVISSSAFADMRAPTANAYSNRGGFHASSAGLAGSLYIASYHASHDVAACCTLGRSATAMFKTGSSTSCAAPDVRTVVANCRPSGALPTIDCMYRAVASSISAGLIPERG